MSGEGDRMKTNEYPRGLFMRKKFKAIFGSVFVVAIFLILSTPPAFAAEMRLLPDGTRCFDLIVNFYSAVNLDGGGEKAYYEESFETFAKRVFVASRGVHRICKIEAYHGELNPFRDIGWLDAVGRSNATLNGIALRGVITIVKDRPPMLGISSPHEIGTTLAHEWGHYAYGLLDEYAANPLSMDDAVEGSLMNTIDEDLQFSVRNNEIEGERGYWQVPRYMDTKRTTHHREYRMSGWELLSGESFSLQELRKNFSGRIVYPEFSRIAPNPHSGAEMPEMPNSLGLREDDPRATEHFEVIWKDAIATFFVVSNGTEVDDAHPQVLGSRNVDEMQSLRARGRNPSLMLYRITNDAHPYDLRSFHEMADLKEFLKMWVAMIEGYGQNHYAGLVRYLNLPFSSQRPLVRRPLAETLQTPLLLSDNQNAADQLFRTIEGMGTPMDLGVAFDATTCLQPARGLQQTLNEYAALKRDNPGKNFDPRIFLFVNGWEELENCMRLEGNVVGGEPLGVRQMIPDLQREGVKVYVFCYAPEYNVGLDRTNCTPEDPYAAPFVQLAKETHGEIFYAHSLDELKDVFVSTKSFEVANYKPLSASGVFQLNPGQEGSAEFVVDSLMEKLDVEVISHGVGNGGEFELIKPNGARLQPTETVNLGNTFVTRFSIAALGNEDIGVWRLVGVNRQAVAPQEQEFPELRQIRVSYNIEPVLRDPEVSYSFDGESSGRVPDTEISEEDRWTDCGACGPEQFRTWFNNLPKDSLTGNPLKYAYTWEPFRISATLTKAGQNISGARVRAILTNSGRPYTPPSFQGEGPVIHPNGIRIELPLQEKEPIISGDAIIDPNNYFVDHLFPWDLGCGRNRECVGYFAFRYNVRLEADNPEGRARLADGTPIQENFLLTREFEVMVSRDGYQQNINVRGGDDHVNGAINDRLATMLAHDEFGNATPENCGLARGYSGGVNIDPCAHQFGVIENAEDRDVVRIQFPQGVNELAVRVYNMRLGMNPRLRIIRADFPWGGETVLQEVTMENGRSQGDYLVARVTREAAQVIPEGGGSPRDWFYAEVSHVRREGEEFRPGSYSIQVGPMEEQDMPPRPEAPAPPPNQPPVFLGAGPDQLTFRAGQQIYLPLGNFFSDPEGSPLQFRVENLPRFLKLNVEDNSLRGKSAASARASRHSVNVIVSDGELETATNLSLTIRKNQAPTLQLAPGQQKYRAGQEVNIKLAGRIFDMDGDALTVKVEGLPDFLQFNRETLEIRGRVPQNVQRRIYPISVIVNDGVFDTLQKFNLEVVP